MLHFWGVGFVALQNSELRTVKTRKSCKVMALSWEKSPMKSHIWLVLTAAASLTLGGPVSASATEVKVLTAGAFKQVVMALVPAYEKQSGN